MARYFDGRSNEVARVQAMMKRIAASPVSIELPDVSPSLQAVRNYRLTHEHAPERSPAKKTAQ